MKKIGLFVCSVMFLFSSYSQNRVDSIHVAHYDININNIDFTNRTIEGYTDLSVVAKVAGLEYVDLDLQQLTVDSIFTNGLLNTNYTYNNNLIHIILQNQINHNDTVQVRIYYHGRPATDSRFGGFYFSGEYAYNLGVASQDLPHNFGRAWYPCLDFFTDKSSYHFNIQTEIGKKAICGGQLIDSVIINDSTMLWQWQLDEPVPTYLTSIAVGNYLHYSDTVHCINGVIPIDIYTPPTYFNNIAGSFARLKDVVHIYENRYGAYRWNRIGYVAVNFSSGAMEHATNITYPQACITGNNTYESLYIHELSHSWFGNLITCAQAEEMWINEGFARYSEAIADEILYPNADPQLDGYKVNIRNLHRSVLLDAHNDDGGFYALNAVPQNVTYGTTSYDKGALVVHALRQYLGDSLFFSAIQQMLNNYSYDNISSSELFGFLSQTTHIPLNDFYEACVNQPGFLHFSVDSIRSTGQQDEYEIYVHQKLYEATHYANGNLVDFSFFSNEGQQYDVNNVAFSGEYATFNVQLPFEPDFAIVDLYEELADATIDYNYTLTESGNQIATYAKCRINVSAVTDTVFVHIENNYVAPDPLKVENESIYAVSTKHFWRVEYTPVNTLEGRLQFSYKATSYLSDDYDLLHNYAVDDIVLLYRRDATDDWHIIPFTQSGTITSGYLFTEQIIPGEYTVGIGDKTVAIADKENEQEFQVFPNPSQETLTIRCADYDRESDYSYQLWNEAGQVLLSGNIDKKSSPINIQNLPNGFYFVQILQKNKRIKTFKVIKN